MVKVPQFCHNQPEAPPSEKITTSPKPSFPPTTICPSMLHTPHTPPPTPCQQPTVMPPQTPSPAPHQNLLTRPHHPTPAPYQSHHNHVWRTSTLWDHYIWTQGFWIPDPLYHSPAPCHQAKKLKKYQLSPEEKHHQEQMALLMMLMNGWMLTRGLLESIMEDSRWSWKALSWTMELTISLLKSVYPAAPWRWQSTSRSSGVKICWFTGW